MDVLILNDYDQEDDESFTVTLSDPDNPELGILGSTTVTIEANDGPPPAPTGLTVASGRVDGEVELSWDEIPETVNILRLEYRYRTDGDYGGWTSVPGYSSRTHSVGGADRWRAALVPNSCGEPKYVREPRPRSKRPSCSTIRAASRYRLTR